MWAAVLAQGHRPFTKHLVGEGGLRPADGWPAGAHALAHGFDLRLAYCEATGRLAAAVRYSERASIGAGMGYSVHGGAVETAFDEATAELVKVTHAASAATLELAVALRRPVPVGQTLRLDAWLCDGAGGGGGGKDPGLRVRTEAALRDGRGALLATCTATLVDVNLLARMSQPGA